MAEISTQWRAGYDAAVAEMRGVVARTGSPAANWAALYLASQREYVERRVADSNCVRCGQGVTSAVHLLDCPPDSSGTVEDAPKRSGSPLTDIELANVLSLIEDEFYRFMPQEGARQRGWDFADGLVRFLGESGWTLHPPRQPGPMFKPGWLREQVDKAVASYNELPLALRTAPSAQLPEERSDERYYLMHDHGPNSVRHAHSVEQGHFGDVNNPQANDHTGVPTGTWEEMQAQAAPERGDENEVDLGHFGCDIPDLNHEGPCVPGRSDEPTEAERLASGEICQPGQPAACGDFHDGPKIHVTEAAGDKVYVIGRRQDRNETFEEWVQRAVRVIDTAPERSDEEPKKSAQTFAVGDWVLVDVGPVTQQRGEIVQVVPADGGGVWEYDVRVRDGEIIAAQPTHVYRDYTRSVSGLPVDGETP